MVAAMPSNLAVRDIETLIHPYTNLDQFRQTGPLVIERGQGIHVYDVDGKAYIEGMSGLWCTALGYGNEELIEAAATQMRKLSFAHLFSAKNHDPAIELAERLKEIAPVPISKVFFCNSGSEANDTQVKLVWYMNNALGLPRKKKIISRIKAYHGITIASASLTGLPTNQIDFDVPIANIRHTACPHHYRFAHEGETEEQFSARLAAELEQMIIAEDPDTVAAFIAEPVMGAGGVIPPPAGYFSAIAPICAKYDLYLICDEVITGFGRLGRMFGCDVVGFAPHAISVAKALSSAYVPIAAVMLPEVMYQAMLVESRKIGTFGHGFTYSGHPVAAAVALKTLEIYARERIVEAVAAKISAVPVAAAGARRPSAGRRGTWTWARWRDRVRRRQAQQTSLRSEGGCEWAMRAVCARRRFDRTRARRRNHALPAAGDQPTTRSTTCSIAWQRRLIARSTGQRGRNC